MSQPPPPNDRPNLVRLSHEVPNPAGLNATGPPAPGRWIRPPDRRRDPREFTSRFFVVGVLGLAALMFQAALRGGSFDPFWATAAGIFFGATVVVGHLWTRTVLRAEPRDLALLEHRGDADVGLVQVAIVRDGKTVGRDRGVVWFENGLLLFSGHATSFALGGEDVLAPEERLGVYREYARQNSQRPLLPPAAVPLRMERGWAYVTVEPLHGGDTIEDKREFRFLKAFAAFLRHPPASRGSRQWPPLEP